MKTAIISAVVVGLAGGTWTWVVPRIEAPAPDPVRVTDARERIGVRRMLTGHRALNFADLVVGEGRAEGLRDFRARLVRAEQARPVYGRARRLCDSGPDAPECWEIAFLQVDGKPGFPVPEAPVVQAEPDLADRAEVIETGTIETADIPPPRDRAQPDPIGLPETAPDAPAPVATHLVARPIINARSGPGTGNTVVAKLVGGTRLDLQDEQNGWGRFVVLDGDAQGTEAWAALRILEDVR